VTGASFKPPVPLKNTIVIKWPGMETY
jgi:hypothetical protein